MKKVTGKAVRVVCAALICALALAAHCRSSEYRKAVPPAAERLYPLLAGYDFDGIEVYEAENRISLCRYAAENEHSSVRVRREVASVPVDAAAVKDARLFRDVMAYCGGVFFATDLNWNGEWSGLCLYPSDPSRIPLRYVSRSAGNQAYWLEDIPDSVLS